MIQRTLVMLSAVLAASVVACSGAPSDSADENMGMEVDEATGAATAVSVKLVGTHKSPKTTITTSIFAVTTKEPDLFNSQPAIIKALTPNTTDNRLTLKPGTYDIQPGSGQYLVIGQFDRSGANDLWIERRLSIQGNQLSMSALDTLNPPSSQSEPVLQKNDAVFIGLSFLTGPVKYEYKDAKTIRVTVPDYKPGIF